MYIGAAFSNKFSIQLILNIYLDKFNLNKGTVLPLSDVHLLLSASGLFQPEPEKRFTIDCDTPTHAEGWDLKTRPRKLSGTF